LDGNSIDQREFAEFQNHKYGTPTSKLRIKTEAFGTMEHASCTIIVVTTIIVVVIATIGLIYQVRPYPSKTPVHRLGVCFP
jgi:hypothetical protein